MAFFVGRNGSSDGIDAFVTAVLNAGFGTGGEAAEVDVLQRIFQVRFLHTPAAQKSRQLPQPCMSSALPHVCACTAILSVRLLPLYHSTNGMAASQDRPVRADALLGSADKVAGLAALSDSADYLADVIARSGALDNAALGSGSRPASPAKGQSTAARVGGMLTLGMSHLMDRCAQLPMRSSALLWC